MTLANKDDPVYVIGDKSPPGDKSRVFEQSIRYDCRGPNGSLATILERIIQKRLSIGLVMLNADGNVLCCNSIARQLFFTREHEDEHLAEIRRQVVSRSRTPLPPESNGSGSSTTPIVQLLFRQGTIWYGLRGFWLDAVADKLSPLVGIVIEQINLQRLDLHKAALLYNLSRREVAVVEALLVGQTDKEIASALRISPETIRWYLKVIRSKMGVSTRTAIVHTILRNGRG